MNDDHAFLSSILANPGDRVLRLVYADWLEERGDPRGEYLRVECRLQDLPLDQAERQQLQERADALRRQCPANWLAALGGPIWCVAANAVLERPYGPGGAETRRGTKHFTPGAKVYVFDFFWGMGGEQVTVIGRHRKAGRYITLSMCAAHLANWRAELVYAPAVIRRITESGGEFGHFPRGSEESMRRAEEIAAMYQQRGTAKQPYATRARHAEPDATPNRGGEVI
jgi:uncharacterized protein (TIGR02996 family)